MSNLNHNALSVFVTGTDTEIGKTFVSSALLRGFVRAGLQAAAMKPIAAGAFEVNGTLHNEDRINSMPRRTCCCRPTCARRIC